MAGQDRSIPNGGNEVYQLSNGTGNSRAQAASLPATSTSLYPPWSSLRALIPFPKRFVHRSRQLSVFVLPSFLRNYDSAGQEHYGKRHVFTALDGLRGWACLLVFNFHFLFTYTHKTMIGWGFGGENWGIHQLPIIHMLISGHVMVAIFFVISGYVLSYKPLKLIRSRSWDQAFCALASSTFRRGLRLYVPSIVGMLWVLVAVRLGCFDYATKVRDEGHTILGTNEQHPPIFSTRKEQIADWYLAVVHLIDPWNWNIDYNFYNPHLWTIPVEFRCSMVLFLTIITVSRMQPWKRLVVTCGFIWYCVRWSRWDVVLFLAGMVMAEIDQIYNIWEGPEVTMVNSPTPEDDHANDLEKNHPTSSRQTQHWTFRPLFWYFFFLLGLFLGSSPNNSPDLTPGFRTLSALTPRTYTEPHRFLQSLGAILIVCSINHSPTLQSPFTTPFAQYLGKISFAFYIVHGPVLHSLGYSIMPNIWYYTGKDGDWGYCLGFAVGWCVCSVVSVWLADVFWRVVDVRSVRLARWVEGKVSLSVSSLDTLKTIGVIHVFNATLTGTDAQVPIMGSKLDMAIPSAESIGNDIGGTLGYYLDAIISWVSDKASDALEGVSKWAMESIPQYASAVGDWATENIPRYASAVSNWVVSGFETFGQWLGQPNVYPLLIAFAISFTLITMLLLCLGFGPAGILPGSLAAAFQSWMYGGFTPAGGLFATCTSIAMLGLVMPAVVGVAVVLAGLITFVAWECGLGR